MDFDDFIQSELGKVGLGKEKFELPKFKPRPTGIRCTCRIMDVDGSMDTWPDLFVSVPDEGHIVQSVSGKRYTVITVVHRSDQDGNPVIELELGRRKSSDVTPIEGGASNVQVY